MSSKSVTVPILNQEYKVVVYWGEPKQLRETLLEHHYNTDDFSKRFLDQQVEDNRGFTFKQDRCYPFIWINADLPASECIGTLAHEAVHAVDFIFQLVNEKTDDSEIFAHSVGAIVREALSSMKLFNNPRNKLAKKKGSKRKVKIRKLRIRYIPRVNHLTPKSYGFGVWHKNGGRSGSSISERELYSMSMEEMVRRTARTAT